MCFLAVATLAACEAARVTAVDMDVQRASMPVSILHASGSQPGAAVDGTANIGILNASQSQPGATVNIPVSLRCLEASVSQPAVALTGTAHVQFGSSSQPFFRVEKDAINVQLTTPPPDLVIPAIVFGLAAMGVALVHVLGVRRRNHG
jgi:hypothetical protein